jgi:hypothetical protein
MKMPFETSCDDTQARRVRLSPNGDLDGNPPVYAVVSGAGTFESLDNGMTIRMISEDNVVGNGPFDTVYSVDAVSSDGTPLHDELTLHVSNDVQTQPATSFGFSADPPEAK